MSGRVRHGTTPTRICWTCGTEFENGGQCLTCKRAWASRNRVLISRTTFEVQCRSYGLTVEDYARMLEAQDHRCAICTGRLAFDRFTHVDHDHTTGAVRGLLCHHCNLVIGQARDNPKTLRSAADYLEREGAR